MIKDRAAQGKISTQDRAKAKFLAESDELDKISES